MGNKEIGSFQPIKIAEGNNTSMDIKTPLRMALICHSIVAINIPTTIHIDNAEIFASQVK